MRLTPEEEESLRWMTSEEKENLCVYACELLQMCDEAHYLAQEALKRSARTLARLELKSHSISFHTKRDAILNRSSISNKENENREYAKIQWEGKILPHGQPSRDTGELCRW